MHFHEKTTPASTRRFVSFVLFLCVTPVIDEAQGRFARYARLLNDNRLILLFFSECAAMPSQAVALTRRNRIPKVFANGLIAPKQGRSRR